MQRFLLKIVINALAFWLATWLIGFFSDTPGITIQPYEDGVLAYVLTLLLIGLIFGLVNGIVGNFIRIVAFPIYVLTLGLIALVVNSLLLLLVSWISGLIGFGLYVENFWWGLLGALILGIISWVLGLLLRPLAGPKKR